MMTEEIRQGTITGFGERLRNARESLHLSEKDAASRLHLNPNIIQILENESFQDAPPPTFLRGYIKSYARLLEMSEYEVNEALEKLGLSIQPSTVAIIPPLSTDNLDRNEKYVKWITYLVIAVLIVMVGIWCNSHYSSLQNTLNQHMLTQQTVSQPIANKIQNTQVIAVPTAQPATTPQQNNVAANPAGSQTAPNQQNNSQPVKSPTDAPGTAQAAAAPTTPAQGSQQAATPTQPTATNNSAPAPANAQSPANANNSTPTNQTGNNKLSKHHSSPADDAGIFDNSDDDGNDDGTSMAIPEPGLEPN